MGISAVLFFFTPVNRFGRVVTRNKAVVWTCLDYK